MKRIVPMVLLLTACATAPAPNPTTTTTTTTTTAPGTTAARPAYVPGETELAALETRLLSRQRALVRFSSESSGAANVVARGPLQWNEERILLAPSGEIEGVLRSGRFEQQNPSPQVRETILLGMVRMGLMHNIYRLYNEQPPDLPDVRAGNVRWDAGSRRFTFDMLVNGQDVGDADLWLGENMLPARRETVVRMQGSELRVVEAYQWLM